MQKNKEQIIEELKISFHNLRMLCEKIPQEQYNISVQDKWSVAENVQHLIVSAKSTAMGYRLPKFLPLLLYGRPKKNSITYDEVVKNYKAKLDAGAKASGVYVPKKTDYQKDKLLKNLGKYAYILISNIENKWSEDDLDKYQVKHPVLGAMTMRELAYFTIYHNGHHKKIVERYYLK